jgi:hypothetical protein
MIFLANLVGSEHIERFIPVADAQSERSLAPPTGDAAPTSTPADSLTGTREMPKFLGSKRMPPAAGSAQVARTERKPPVAGKPPARAVSKQPPRLGTAAVKATSAPKPATKSAAKIAPAATAGRDAPSDIARAQVIADAARLVQWGRKWYELPELIARMAGRPSLPEVRRILKESKTAIDSKAGGSAG